MRTTIEVDDPLFRELKRQAVARGTSLRKLVNELLRRALTQQEPPRKYHLNWKVDPRGTIQPGVRLDDRESLFDLMDGR